MKSGLRLWMEWVLVAVVLVGLVAPAGAMTGDVGGRADTAAYDIAVTTHPEVEDIVPDQDVVELLVRVTRGGEPARDVDLSYRLHAPPRTFWFSTDFPVVEGTPLLNGTVHLPGGFHETAMILPIRGTYRLQTRVDGPRGTASKTVTFGVSENPQEKVNLALFLGGLVLLGAVAGYVVSLAAGASVPTGLVALLVSGGLFVVGSPTTVMAHGQGDWDPEALQQQTGIQGRTGEFAVEVGLFPQPVRVGEMLNVKLRVRPRRDEGAPSRDHEHEHSEHGHGGKVESESHHGHGSDELYRAEARFVHAEGGLEMINQPLYLEDGNGQFDVQLFDGAPHYLVVDVYRAGEVEAGHGHAHVSSESDHESAHDEHADNGHAEEASGDEQAHEDEHGEAKPPWEEKGLYRLNAGEHTLRFHESEDPSMKWVLLPAPESHSDERARRLFEQDCPTIEPGASVSSNRACVRLTLNPDGTDYTLNVEDSGRYRLYTEHVPAEFDMMLFAPDGKAMSPERRVVPGKGEFVARVVRRVGVEPIPPPLDDVVKSMLTLLSVVLVGFLGGYYAPRWIG